ncbi:MAG: hypothetical protein H6697_10095 [Myxococcales bacterium]|nr:hypothetical protein [Myxococcales bacterium]
MALGAVRCGGEAPPVVEVDDAAAEVTHDAGSDPSRDALADTGRADDGSGAPDTPPPDARPTEAACGDGIDNDLDGDIDCVDNDCTFDPLCHGVQAEICDDGLDNDLDGDTDCADDDCDPRTCRAVELCDGGDGDGDGLVDCADPDCSDAPACVEFTKFAALQGCTPSSRSDAFLVVVGERPIELRLRVGVDDELQLRALPAPGDYAAPTAALPSPAAHWTDCPGDGRCLSVELPVGSVEVVVAPGAACVGDGDVSYALTLRGGGEVFQTLDDVGLPITEPDVETSCDDGVDNDGDFDVDCADVDCAASCR